MKFLINHQQLRKASVSKTEAKDLTLIAKRVSAIKLPALEKSAKAKIADDIGFGYHAHRRAYFRAWESVAVSLIIFVLIFAQSSKPGSALYSVKKGTTKVHDFIQDNVPFIHHDDNEQELNEDNANKDTSNSNKSENNDDKSGTNSSVNSGDSSNSILNSGNSNTGSGSSNSGPGSSGSGQSSGSSGHDSSGSGSMDSNSGNQRSNSGPGNGSSGSGGN